jgi:hypothetical protein
MMIEETQNRTSASPALIAAFPQWYGPKACDPDMGGGDVELDNLLAKLAAKFCGVGGALSTSSEQHAFQAGALIGYLYLNQTECIPVPDFWIKESHHFYSGLVMGRAAKKLEDASGRIPWTPVIVAAVGALTAGTVYGQSLLSWLASIAV